jgi:hypothetical protein
MNHPVIVTPEPEAVHYGVPVTCIGEDGDMLAFGHHEPRRALAAFNRHARTEIGLANILDDRSASAEDLLGDIAQGWGLFRKPAGDEDPDWEWVMDPCQAGAEHATPYTHLSVA